MHQPIKLHKAAPRALTKAKDGSGRESDPHALVVHLADVEVARAVDLGVNDNRYIQRSHLGHILRAGDTVMGFDLHGVRML